MVVDMKAKFLIVVLAALVLATGTVWAQKGHHNRRAEHKELSYGAGCEKDDRPDERKPVAL